MPLNTADHDADALARHRLSRDEHLDVLYKHFRDSLPDNEEMVHAGFKEMNMLTGVVGLGVRYTVKRTFKNGNSRQETRSSWLEPTYCPFTGVKLRAD